MKTSIFTYSGTGNSLFTAKRLAGMLESADVYPITRLDTARFSQDDAVGFIFPVYFYNVPRFVRDICARSGPQNAGYVFCVATCGGKAGNTLPNFTDCLQSAGAKLDYGAVVKLPDNSVYYRTSPETIERDFRELEPALETIARDITAQAQNTQLLKPSRMNAAVGVALRVGMKVALRYEDKRVNEEMCTHCGLCVRLCPSGNIAMESGKIAFGNQCADCFRCIQWCPAQAIRFGKLSVDASTQYRCPGIKAADLAAQ